MRNYGKVNVLNAAENILIGSEHFFLQELHIRLTDESDPFFLQFLYLGEEDFHRLVYKSLKIDII